MNVSDSERFAGALEYLGFQKTSQEDADLLIINICSVKQSAVDKALSHKRKGSQKVILTGCYLEKDKKRFDVDYFMRIDKLKDLKSILNKLGFNIDKSLDISHYLDLTPLYGSKISALVPIMTGCNNFCSYCVVPYVRDREISRPMDDILCEINELIKRGVKEIWLLGQNVNSYKPNFSELISRIDQIEGKFWVRFTSSHPKDLNAEMIETFAKSKKITPYFNLPIQSGDDTILKMMNRPYTSKKYTNLVKQIRSSFKRHRNEELFLSTDIIVGFPGETKKQFKNTKKAAKSIKFSMAYISRYSPRPHTKAFEIKDDVPNQEKQRREKEVDKIIRKTALKFNKKFLNKEVECLITHKKKDWFVGKTKHYQTIMIKSDKDLINQFTTVKIDKVESFRLFSNT
jgi:tRNA-2-methylthio-N6-dimethylallyladenosine synthase